MNYQEVLRELGLTQEDMDRAKAMLPVPEVSSDERNVYFGRSKIEGEGVFAIRNFGNGERIAPLQRDKNWTLTGMMTNHSGEPNTRFHQGDLIATQNILEGDELTLDYLQVRKG